MNAKYHSCKYNKILLKRLAIISYLLFISAFTIPSQAIASPTPAEKNESAFISLNETQKPISAILKDIEKQSNYVFVYNSAEIDLSMPVTLKMTSASIKSIMNVLLKNTSFKYEISNRQVLILKDNETKSNKIKASGKVVDAETGEPLIGVTIQVKGENIGSITDIEGSYDIE
ncbi:MAG: carboxypeptidase-like regulatory domain-containing protein, partial [Muribaculaceae bacterium]